MICPNCGRETTEGKYCEHCKNSTEFIKRFDVRPTSFPGDKRVSYLNPGVVNSEAVNHEMPKTRSKKKKSSELVLVLAASFLCVCLFLLGHYLGVKSVDTTSIVVQNEDIKNSVNDSPSEETHTETSIAPIEQEAPAPTITIEQVVVLIPEVEVAFDLNLPLDADLTEPLVTPDPISLGNILPSVPDVINLEFTGWNTRKDGTGTFLCSNVPFDFDIKDSITLYAQWRALIDDYSGGYSTSDWDDFLSNQPEWDAKTTGNGSENTHLIPWVSDKSNDENQP